MTKVLVSDPIDQAGISILSQVAQVDKHVGLSEAELKKIIGEYDGMMIRSGTKVTALPRWLAGEDHSWGSLQADRRWPAYSTAAFAAPECRCFAETDVYRIVRSRLRLSPIHL